MKMLTKIICIFLSIVICIPAFAVEKVYFVYTDPAGTPMAMTNADGAIVWNAEYKPFGEIYQVVAPGFENNRMFVSKELDAESGLYYFGARYMEARIGRFISPDPMGSAKPLLNPQGLNPYAYSANNPYRYVDPDGRAFLELKNSGDYSQARQQFVENYLSWAPTWLQEAIYPSTPSSIVDIGIGPMPLMAPGASAARIVYRGLAAGENPVAGIVARAPEATNSVVSHVAGERASQWISTTRSLEVATSRYGQNGVVAIDLSKVGEQTVVDLTRGIPGLPRNSMLSNWAIKDQEVLIRGRIPAEAITRIP